MAGSQIEIFPSAMGNLLLGISLDLLGKLRKPSAFRHRSRSMQSVSAGSPKVEYSRADQWERFAAEKRSTCYSS